MKSEKAVYVYDGTPEGFFCCVYNLYYNRIKPEDIKDYDSFVPSLRQNIDIETRPDKARRVSRAMEEKIYPGCVEFLKKCLLTNLDGKEMIMARYVAKGFRYGRKIKNMLADDDVNALFKAVISLEKERQHYLGIVRFYRTGDVYISKINPRNRILSLMAWHFSDRFADENFLIYDECHSEALVSRRGRYKIIKAERVMLPRADRREEELTRRWKNFFETLSIKERENPKLQRSFLPRYQWKNLPELKDREKETKIKVYKKLSPAGGIVIAEKE